MTCSSEESTARESRAVLLSTDMFSGVPHGSSSDARVVNHRSSPPRPPRRSELKYIVNSSFERNAYISLESVFTGGAPLMGQDQSPNVSVLCGEEPAAATKHASRPSVRDCRISPPLKH